MSVGLGFGTRIGILLGVLGLSVMGGMWAAETYAPRDGLVGLKLDGAVIPAEAQASDAALRDFASKRAEAILSRSVRITLDGDDVTAALFASDRAGAPAGRRATLRELGVGVDVEGAVLRASRLEHEGNLLERYELRKEAKRGAIDVPLRSAIDASVALPWILAVKESTDLPPVSARLDLDKKVTVPGRLGRYIDPDAALEAVLAVAEHPEMDAVAMPTRSFPPHVTEAFVDKLDIAAQLSAYETYFSRAGDQARRGKNIDVATQKIDGLVLSPGELVSFNDVVGERSEDNGFAKSWEIYKGEMVEGIGGGTCQVASTFYATLLFGGMDVVERLPHSRPSAYIPMGLDATVVYPVVDLKLRNPYDFPVVVHAKTEGNKLKMQLFGSQKPAKVSFQREVEDTFPYKRKVVFEPKLRWSKRVVVKQHGIKGYKIKRTRIVEYKNGTRKKETNTDLYPPTTEIYEVPPGFDVALLPPLPDADQDDDDAPETPSVATGAGTVQLPTRGHEAPNPAASPAGCTGECATVALDIIEGAGAHAPTEAQMNPPKTIMLTR